MRAYGAIFRWIRRLLRHRPLDVRPQYACVASPVPPRLHPKSVAVVFCMTALIMSALPAWASDVLIVQSSRNAAYDEAVRGFRSTFGGSVETVVLSDYAEVDVPRLVREEQPRLVLAVGDPAVTASRKVRSVPVESLMALSPAARTMGDNGVGISASPERYLALLKSMGARQVGVVYDPSRTGKYVKRAQQAAQRLGMEVVAREVRSSRDAIARLDHLKGAVDALWMLPDTTAVTAETVAAYCSFSLEQRVPLVTFSAAHLAKGAVAALEVDRSDMGRQAGELAMSLLNGTAEDEPVRVDARTVHLRTNEAVAKKLGISLSGAEKAVLMTPRE